MQTDLELDHDAHLIRWYAFNGWLDDPLDWLSGVENEHRVEMTFRELGLLCQRDKQSWDHAITQRERLRYQKQLDPHYVPLKPFEGHRARTRQPR